MSVCGWMAGAAVAQTIPATPPPALGPSAQLSPGIQLPPPTWDPYAPPGAQPSTLLGDGSSLPSMQFDGFSEQFQQATRLINEIRFEYEFIPYSGSNGFGINQLGIRGSVAFPLFNLETPFLVTPGFAVSYWQGPIQPDTDLPPSVFDGYLEASWKPKLAPWLSADLAASVGAYSSFDQVTEKSIRFPAHGYAVLALTDRFDVKLGVEYLDRNRVKILPAGGLICRPNADVVFEILFPNPKVSRRITNIGNTEWWMYVRGNYGGGAWAVTRLSGSYESVDYNDIRILFGLDWRNPGTLDGFFEIGIAMDREIVYKTSPIFRPTTAFLLRAGLIY